MKCFSVVALLGAAIPSAAQDRDQVNIRLHEWFDRERADGVTDAGHPTTLDLLHAGGQMTFNTYCHWLRKEKRRDEIAIPQPQEEQEDLPTPEFEPVPTIPLFRGGGVGGKYQFGTGLSIPTIDVRSPTDSVSVSFNQIETEGMPGLFLSTTVGFGEFEILLFADYVTGKFDGGSRESERTTSDGHGGSTTVTDRFEFDGKIHLMEIGLAPTLTRFQTDDGTLRVDVAIAAGLYYGELTDLRVARTGEVNESLPVAYERLFGFFAGPTLHGSLRLFERIRLGFFGEFWRLLGDADGWTGLGGVELGIEF